MRTVQARPVEVEALLLQHFDADTVLVYQQAIGARAVEEATRDQRMHAAQVQLDEGQPTADRLRALADMVDPGKRGASGPYPAALVTWSQP